MGLFGHRERNTCSDGLVCRLVSERKHGNLSRVVMVRLHEHALRLSCIHVLALPVPHVRTSGSDFEKQLRASKAHDEKDVKRKEDENERKAREKF